ncbi:hypothetical protein IY145_23530 [Methylosinus sp. H3A]|uniref:hypothetical protein n=1 Tax=Methylosinus sp. H3A TaxID=2785786 RepID=UPI0018C25540|nr:hypothetical protein [Methylosinus sp. H3A]MBG0812321.1 hypothetical protein [Methylosinus sp. H3A]
MLTAYLIDPTAATICKVRLNPSNVGAALRHHIGCKLLDRVWIDDRHFVHLDEEALLAPVTGLWYVPHSSPQPYAGRAVILAEARNGAVEEPLRPIEHFASAIRVARPVAVSQFTDIEPAPADAMGVNVIIGARLAGFKLELEDLPLSVLQS